MEKALEKKKKVSEKKKKKADKAMKKASEKKKKKKTSDQHTVKSLWQKILIIFFASSLISIIILRVPKSLGVAMDCYACIWLTSRLSYVIFNFYTRESKQISYCKLRPFCPSSSSSICGFGYDSLSNDYKLVKLGRQSIYIYSLRAGSWKKVQDYVKNSFSVEYNCFPTRGMLLNGALHWFCLDINSNRKSKIAAFDLVGEKVTEIPLPSFFTNVHKTCGMGVFGGCLCVKVPDIDEFWVMKEYRVEQSWTKVHVEFPNSLYAKPLDLLNNDEILMRTLGFNLGLYNTSERSYRDLVLHGFSDITCQFFLLIPRMICHFSFKYL
ncbi:F-box/kelch-repeat protein At3g06240-like [Cornus florida]|uniref:F-box/kelch-repeat protein At3g06240-like n=1 Tax=Cornus florida TaxID=4283 RepID=UPI00289EEB8F|nr:F-box/kelch-repeat protein At3g06240-like [Cornus florida]